MMNTNFAQILVSGLKSTSNRCKVGFMALAFTFVFLGMGTTSHAQSLKTSDSKIDASVLDNYSFKVQSSHVLDVLRSAKEDLSSPDGDEVYKNLKNYFIDGIVSNLNNSNNDVKTAVHAAFYSLSNYANRFRNPGNRVDEVATEVSNLIH